MATSTKGSRKWRFPILRNVVGHSLYWRFSRWIAARDAHHQGVIKVSVQEAYTKQGWRASKRTRKMGLFSCFRGASPVAVEGGSGNSSRRVHQHDTDAATPSGSPVATYDSAKSCDAMWDKLPELKARQPAATAALDGNRCELQPSDYLEARSGWARTYSRRRSSLASAMHARRPRGASRRAVTDIVDDGMDKVQDGAVHDRAAECQCGRLVPIVADQGTIIRRFVLTCGSQASSPQFVASTVSTAQLSSGLPESSETRPPHRPACNHFFSCAVMCSHGIDCAQRSQEDAHVSH
jgi:hypothetical protein